jgi:3-phenylpropionate/trans-cinnamate dioxygenase ferredoxin reductase subunit
MTDPVVIVGAGQAGVQTALSLRDEGFDGAITLVADEPGLPYQRPPLSKAYLLGKLDDEGVLLKGAAVYDDYNLTYLESVKAEAIDRGRRTVALSNGQTLPYGHLVLATGARQRELDVPGADLDGVMTLRTLAHAKALMARIDGVKQAVVVGGGFIGLEFAAVARAKGIAVVVVEVAPRPMGRALSTEMSRFFEERHVAWGANFMFGSGVVELLGEGHVTGVRLSDGVTIPADLVLIGAGVLPNVELAEAAGLAVDNGIVVDGQMLTADPHISAIGDCARHPNPFSAVGAVRIESVQNATDQGRLVAGRLMGKAKPYDAVPWFWSDQGDLKLQIAGLGTGHDTAVVRGDPASGAFSVFCFKDGKLLAVESVNKGPDHVMGRRLISSGVRVTPQQAADETIPLKSLLVPAPPLAVV